MDSRLTRLSLVATLALLVTIEVRAQSSYPMLMDAAPLAVQVGKTTEVELSARYNLYGAYGAFISGQGVTIEFDPPKPLEVAKDEKPAEAKATAAATKDEKKDEKKSAEAKPEAKLAPKKPEQPKLKVRFTVAADAQPGVRDFRVATPQGVSTLGQIVIVRDPITREKNPNDALEKATPITLPGTACGAIEAAEDVDFFKFTIDKPAALTFHVRSQRCQDKIHDLQAHSDPLITIRNATGSVLALSDNYFFADPLLNYNFTIPGDYYLEIRDVRYQGNAYWQYSVEINPRPFVTNVFPLAMHRDEATQVELVGFNLPADPHASLLVPKDMPAGMQWLTLPIAGGQATPAPIFVHDLPNVLEASSAGKEAAPQTITVPACVNGRILKEAEVDLYSFEAKKGDNFRIELVARRHQSQLDPIVGIRNEKGQRLTENDDFALGRLSSGDSCIESWSAPADGVYTIELRDLHLQGGPDFVYALLVTRAEPHYWLWLDSDKTPLTPGVANAIYARVTRKNGFKGEIQLAIDGLPPGVKATCGKILDGQNDGCIIVQADSTVGNRFSNVTITGTHTPSEGPAMTVTAQPYQEIYFPGGGRGHYYAPWHTVSVGEPQDILSVKITPNAIALKPGESAKIDITIERAEGFDKNVTLDVMYRHLGSMFGNSLPPGVLLDDKNSKTVINGKALQGYITLKVDPKTAVPVENQIVPVMAQVSLNFVMKMSYCSEPLTITVKNP